MGGRVKDVVYVVYHTERSWDDGEEAKYLKEEGDEQVDRKNDDRTASHFPRCR